MGVIRNWWAAQPWRIVGPGRWRYWTIYRTMRQGSWNPQAGRWMAGGEPRGRLAALWGAVAFPHVHDDEGEWLPDWTVHPGETLLETLAERDMTYEQLSFKMGVRPSAVRDVLAEVAEITPDFAARLERVLGISSGFWLNLQAVHREQSARLARTVGEDGMTVDLAINPEVARLAEESGIDVTRCEFCGGPLDAEHPWRRGQDGACAHEACLTIAEGGNAEAV